MKRFEICTGVREKELGVGLGIAPPKSQFLFSNTTTNSESFFIQNYFVLSQFSNPYLTTVNKIYPIKKGPFGGYFAGYPV